MALAAVLAPKHLLVVISALAALSLERSHRARSAHTAVYAYIHCSTEFCNSNNSSNSRGSSSCAHCTQEAHTFCYISYPCTCFEYRSVKTQGDFHAGTRERAKHAERSRTERPTPVGRRPSKVASSIPRFPRNAHSNRHGFRISGYTVAYQQASRAAEQQGWSGALSTTSYIQQYCVR